MTVGIRDKLIEQQIRVFRRDGGRWFAKVYDVITDDSEFEGRNASEAVERAMEFATANATYRAPFRVFP